MHPKMDWGGVVTESGRWVVPPCCLWQQGIDATYEKLSLHKTQVYGIKVGSYRTL